MLRERYTSDNINGNSSNNRRRGFARSGGRNYISLLIIILSIVLVFVFANRVLNSKSDINNTPYSYEDSQKWSIFEPKHTNNDNKKNDEAIKLQINFNKHLNKKNNDNEKEDHHDKDNNHHENDQDNENNNHHNKDQDHENNNHHDKNIKKKNKDKDEEDENNNHHDKNIKKKNKDKDEEDDDEVDKILKNPDNTVHVYVTKDHNMVLRHWYTSVLKGILPRKDVSLFHFDTHSDLHLPFDGIDYSDDDPLIFTKAMAKKDKMLKTAVGNKHKKKKKKTNDDDDDDDDDDNDDNDDDDGRDDRRKKARVWSNPWYFPQSFEEATELSKHLEIGNFIPHSFNNGLVTSMTWIRPEWGDPNTFMQPSIGKHVLKFGYDQYGHYCVNSKEWEKEGQKYCNSTSMHLQQPVTIRSIKFPDLLKLATNSSTNILNNLIERRNSHLILDIDYDFLSTVDPDFPGYVKKGLKADFMFKWDSISRACYNAKCCAPKTKRKYKFMWQYVRALFRARHDIQINRVYDSCIHRVNWIKKSNKTSRAMKRRHRRIRKRKKTSKKLKKSRSKGLDMCYATKRIFFRELWKLRKRMSHKQSMLMLNRLSSEHHDLEDSIIGTIDGFFSVDPTYVAELEEIQDRLRDMAKFLIQPSIGENIRLITVTRSREWLPRGFLPYAEHGILDMLKAVLKKVNRKVQIHLDASIKHLSGRPGDCNAKPSESICYDMNFFLGDITN